MANWSANAVTTRRFFSERDRDFRHFYFCAANLPALQASDDALAVLKTERLVTDLVGNEARWAELLASLEQAGFRRYTKLQRMARTGQVDRSAKRRGQFAGGLARKKPTAPPFWN